MPTRRHNPPDPRGTIPGDLKYCPYCGAQLAQIAVKCNACQQWLDLTKRPPWAKEVDDLWSGTFDVARSQQAAGGPDAARLGEIGNRIYDYVAQQIERGAPPPWMWRDPSASLKQTLAQAGLSAPQPSAHAPQPVVPAPQPVAPAPQPVAPAPQPIAPAPQPVAPAPQPVAPAPQPVAPAPAPQPAWQPPASGGWQAPTAAPTADERQRSETQPGGSRTFSPSQPAAQAPQPVAPAAPAPALGARAPVAATAPQPVAPAPMAAPAPQPVPPAPQPAPFAPGHDPEAAMAATMEAPPVGRWQPDDPNEPAHAPRPQAAHPAPAPPPGLMETPGGPAPGFGDGPQGIPIDRLQPGKPTKPRRRSFTREFLGETFVEQAEMAEAAAAAGVAAGESGEFDSTFGEAVSARSSFPWKWVVIAVVVAGATGGAIVFFAG